MPHSEPVCPTYEGEFESLRGMRVHHARAHDEVLPNRIYADCQTEFHDPDPNRVYCGDCMPSRGRTRDRWTYGNTEGTCIECDATYLYYPSEKPGRYCPDCVDDDSMSCTPPSEEWGAGTTGVDGEYCGEPILVYRWRVENRETIFCDRGCYSTWLSETTLHGLTSSTKYKGSWWVTKRLALERDEFSCVRCGATKDDLGRNPDVHHLVPVRTFEDPDDAHTLENVVCLCPGCHTKVEWYGAGVEDEVRKEGTTN